MAATLGPLAGYVVLDFTQILAGPYCTQLLAEAGATVIKAEPPGGEFSRLRGRTRVDSSGNSVSSYSAAVNRHKRSICLDLKNEEGLRIAKELIAQADVVIENFARGAFDRLGIDFKSLRQERPELITVSISLFGGFESAGELAARAGTAIVAESESGITGLQRFDDGSPMGLSHSLPLGDMCAGLAAYGAIVTALLARASTGVGEHIDLSMVRVLLSLNSNAITAEDMTDRTAPPPSPPRTAGYGIFPAIDGYVSVGANNDGLFAKVTQVIGQEWMTSDPRYAHREQRNQNVDEVHHLIAAWTSARPATQVVDAMASRGVPCGLIATPRNILDSEDIARLGLLEDVGDGMGGVLHVPSNPFGHRQSAPAIPLPNEHGRELMSELLGIDDKRYEELLKAGAFGTD